MIFDLWSELDKYQVLECEVMRKISDFQKNLTLESSCGHYNLLDNKLTVDIFQAENNSNRNEASVEIHKDYIDLQTVLTGESINFYQRTDNLLPKGDFNIEKDYQLFVPDFSNVIRLHLTPEKFAIYFPYEGHITSFAELATPKSFTKVVYKIHKGFIKKGDCK